MLSVFKGVGQSFVEWVQVMIPYTSLSLSSHRYEDCFKSKQKREAFFIYETEIYNMKCHAFEGKVLFVGVSSYHSFLDPTKNISVGI